MTIEVLQRDYPNKSHVVAEHPEPHVVETECGLHFETANELPIHTFTFDPQTPVMERTYTPPVPEARCGNCPWDDVPRV